MFQVIFLEQLLVKLFNDSGMFDKKKSKVTLIKKKISPKKTKTKCLKEVLCKDQVIFKSGTSDQTIAKAFHNVVNLRISTAHSYNADFTVTNNPVKNALIKVYRYDKERKTLFSYLCRYIGKIAVA